MSLSRNDDAKLRFFFVILIDLGKSFALRSVFSQKPFSDLPKITTFAKQVANLTLQSVTMKSSCVIVFFFETTA